MTDDIAAVLPYWGKAEPVDVGPILDPSASSDGKTVKMRIYGPIASIGAPYAVSAKEFGEALEEVDADTIELHIHSPGGSAWDGTAIKNQLQQHKATVNVVVDGIAASAASMIAMAGDTVSVAPSAQLMVHDASALVIGQAADLKTAAEMLDKISDSYADAYAAKAGGTRADWRAAMQPETWYNADEAVKAGLADRVLPKTKKAAEPKTLFDLTVFAHAGRADETAPEPFIPAARAACACGPDGSPAVTGAQHRDECAHKPPAEPPEKHPSKEGAVVMTDTEIKALRERLGLAEDADEATVTAAAVAHALADKPGDTPTDPVEALAKEHDLKPEQVRDALAVAAGTADLKAPEGKVIISETLLDELKSNAKLGAEARAKQLEDERDATIASAFSDGKISADRRDAWKTAWDKDPEGTKADLASLEVRFPVAKTSGYSGSDGSDGDGTKPFTDDEADALAALSGTTKEALLNG